MGGGIGWLGDPVENPDMFLQAGMGTIAADVASGGSPGVSLSSDATPRPGFSTCERHFKVAGENFAQAVFAQNVW
jgi:hypothetical protein